MIHDLDILQAVQQKLKERFPYPVYLQEVKEGFAPPAFFLKTMTVVTPQKETEVYRDTDLYITYLPRKQAKARPSTPCFCCGRFVPGRAEGRRPLSPCRVYE